MTFGIVRSWRNTYFRRPHVQSEFFGPVRPRGATGWWLCSILVLAWAMHPSPAFAICLISADPGIRELQNLVDTDAAQALKQVRTQLDAFGHTPQPDAQRLASLYAVQAQAYSILRQRCLA